MNSMNDYRINCSIITFCEVRLGVAVADGFAVVDLSGLRLWLLPQ
jgi:hypothetical protein